MSMSSLITYLEAIAQSIPVEMFSFFGAFIEELIAPIPSPFVMTLAGAVTSAQGYEMSYLLVVSLIGAVGKTIAAWILYVVAMKLEGIIIDKFGKFFGVTHSDIDNLSGKLNKGWKDNLVLFVIRSLPIMPSAPVSVICGLIKINLKTFIIATFFGTFIRNLAFLYIGFQGTESANELAAGINQSETYGKIIFLALVVVGVLWAYKQRGKKPTGANTHAEKPTEIDSGK